MTDLPNSLRLLLVLLVALLLLVSCTDREDSAEDAVAEGLVVDAPVATGAMRGGLTFELPKPGHSKQDTMPIFCETIEE